MNNASLLLIAMAEQCRTLLQSSAHDFQEPQHTPLPTRLGVRHLLLMCDQIEKNAEEWPETKQHRWIGFIQAGLMANRIIDMQGLREMFNDAKNAYGSGNEDIDLIDHLDPESDFKMDIGGES